MTSRDFCYWLQGYFELRGRETLVPTSLTFTAEQVQGIHNHLRMVFIHEIDPSHGGKEHRDKLQAAHDSPQPVATVSVSAFEQTTGRPLRFDLPPEFPGGKMNC